MQRFMHVLQHWTPLQVKENNVVPVKEVVSLPVFPEFKKLTLEDRHIIEEFVKDHPPYSDFNFTSLWCWNTNDSTMFSILYDNLVIQMQDYTTGKTIFTYIGTNEPVLTTERLLNYAENFGVTELSLIPEVTHNELQKHDHPFEVVEDRDNFDYIYKLEHIVKMCGSKLRSKLKLMDDFVEDNEVDVKVSKGITKDSHDAIITLFHKWKHHKNPTPEEYEHELEAINRCLDAADKSDLTTVIVYVAGKPAGFTISESVQHDHSITHFGKVSYDYPGTWEYLLHQTAKVHHNDGKISLNQEQDLGLQHLRQGKEMWDPSHFLKKYKITRKI